MNFRRAILFCVLFLAGCTCGDEKQYRYQFSNESGLRVSIVMDELDKALPDSLVIAAGESYEWENLAQRDGFFPLRVLQGIKVYFGDDTMIAYSPADPRSPENYYNFVLTQIRGNYYLATYTITTKDYENAQVTAENNTE